MGKQCFNIREKPSSSSCHIQSAKYSMKNSSDDCRFFLQSKLSHPYTSWTLQTQGNGVEETEEKTERNSCADHKNSRYIHARKRKEPDSVKTDVSPGEDNVRHLYQRFGDESLSNRPGLKHRQNHSGHGTKKRAFFCEPLMELIQRIKRYEFLGARS